MTPQAVERLLYLTMEGEVIRSLLSGNDTQCFTTEQFEDAKDAWIAGVTGSTREQMGLGRPPREIARDRKSVV